MDQRPAAVAFPDVNLLVYHSGYERDPEREEGAFDPVTPTGVDRLVASLAGGAARCSSARPNHFSKPRYGPSFSRSPANFMRTLTSSRSVSSARRFIQT